MRETERRQEEGRELMEGVGGGGCLLNQLQIGEETTVVVSNSGTL